LLAGIAGGVAGAGIVLLFVAAARLTRSLAELPTTAGEDMTARCLGLRAHLRENEQLDELPPAAVQLWGRHFAYAGAMGVARTAVELLPFGTEDDNGAWSRFGGRWRRVRVRYPRAWPPGWGKHPAFALFLALLWGAVAVAALYGLTRLGESAAEAIFLAVRSVPDLWATRRSTGELVRARRCRQIFQSGDSDNPRCWYYLALDDGTRRRIRSWRVRRDIYDAHSQGETVSAMYTPTLGYVRELRTVTS
jgi:hypothetical protein